MNVITKQIELIKRLDQLIRLQATGNPTALSIRLGISKTKLYRVINMMRDFNAPIIYNDSLQSFVYAQEVGFQFGFYSRDANHNDLSSYA